MRRLSTAIALVAAALFVLCALKDIAAPWYFGHNGFNGAAFSQAAKNSLRFGIVPQAQYYTGLEPPPPIDLYTNHPLMLHGHLVTAFALLGVHEWAARLVPASYSLLTLLLLFFIVRRHYDQRVAVASVIVYALTPLNLIYANMINHEQGAIFWCLLMVHFYLCWLQAHRWRYVVGVVVATTVATQFDWPAYYIAFFMALHTIAVGVRGPRPLWKWRPAYTWLFLFSAVVLLNFGGYFAWVRAVREGLDAARLAFSGRIGMPWDYPLKALERSWYLHGPLLLTLFTGWLGWTLRRAYRRELGHRHLLPFVFIGAQAIHSTAFGLAGTFHEYWPYYMSPVFAIGIGELAVSSIDWGGRLIPSVARKPALVGATVLGVLLVGQTAFAGYSFFRFQPRGGSLFHDDFRDLRPQSRWAREMTRRYPRGTAHYFVHPSIKVHKAQLPYYLDSPIKVTTYAASKMGELTGLTATDLGDPQAPRLTRYFITSQRHRRGVVIFDRRFAVVDTSLRPKEVVQLLSRPRDDSLLRRWLGAVHYEYAPDPNPIDVDELLAHEPRVRADRRAGGHGGDPFLVECPDGRPISALEVYTVPWNGTERHIVGAVRPRCPSGPLAWQKTEPRDVSVHRLSCQTGEHPVGLTGRAGSLVDAIALRCLGPRSDGREGALARITRPTKPIGGTGGARYTLSCPDGTEIIGLFGNAGAALDGIGITCADIQ